MRRALSALAALAVFALPMVASGDGTVTLQRHGSTYDSHHWDIAVGGERRMYATAKYVVAGDSCEDEPYLHCGVLRRNQQGAWVEEEWQNATYCLMALPMEHNTFRFKVSNESTCTLSVTFGVQQGDNW